MMQKIHTITIHGFKSIRAIDELKLGAINVVIGANGSGKSNFIGVFSFLRAISLGGLQEYVAKAGGAEKVAFFGSKVTPEILIDVAFDEQVNGYAVALLCTDADDLVPIREVVRFWDKTKYPDPWSKLLQRQGKEAGISSGAEGGTVALRVKAHLGAWRLFHFHDTSSTSPMKKIVDVDDNHFLRRDASNLAAFLYLLRETHRESYDLIQRTVQLVAPFFDEFQLEPQQLNPNKIRLEWRHKNSDTYFDASSLSDGTLRFIALATLFLQPMEFRPSAILVDEPELGLHPYAIAILAALVKQSSSATQVILSTQSPILLDHFQPEDVLIAERVDGGTQLQRVDGNRLSEWLTEYGLGQLWEKNELGGRPGGK